MKADNKQVVQGFIHQLTLEGDLVRVPMTKATCNNSDHAFCFMKWDCKNPLKNDI